MVAGMIGGKPMNNSTENNNRKEDILEKSRQSRQDEGIEHAISQGARKGNYYALEIISFPLLILSLITWQLLAVYAFSSVILASWFGEFFAKYRILKQKRYLIAAIFFGLHGLAVVVLFVRYVAMLQGWCS
jgi:hypothetical protein